MHAEPGAVVPLDAEMAGTIAGWVGSRAEVVMFAGPTLPWPLNGDDLVASAREPGRSVHVVLDATGRPVATGSLLIRPADVRIGRVLVAPDRRGEGWGRVVLEALIERAVAMPDVSEMTLGVYEHNAAARRLYERFGFADTGERTSVDVDGERWVGLQLTLAVHR